MIKVIDLFSGVGGMSLGAARAGCTLVGAVELDPIAIHTHKVNFPKSQHLESDITEISGRAILDAFNLKTSELTGVIGGPPCQGFSSMGKGNVDDPRNALFSHFFRLVFDLKPDFFVAENVPGILNTKYDAIRKKAFHIVEKEYEILEPITLRASDVGAPTTRTRVFFIGIKKNRYYKLSASDLFSKENNLTYVKDALLGLPEKVKFNEDVWSIVEKVSNSYSQTLSSNVPKNVGDQVAIKRYFERNEVYGMIGTRHTEHVINRFLKVLPGEKDPISKAPRLNPEGFCPTLRAGTGKDRGSYQAVRPIHPTEARVITPREAARLQGFPDWFQFHKTKWHSFRQIGNSVSPIVSEYLLKKIIEKLR